uniref:Uncharacterized protein n=1 Tax=Anguilla anguilla TaxID=7936 RepID=A0A0E9VF60_ANGAN
MMFISYQFHCNFSCIPLLKERMYCWLRIQILPSTLRNKQKRLSPH